MFLGTLIPADRSMRMHKKLVLGNWFEGPKFLRGLSIDFFPFQTDDKLKFVDAFAECKVKNAALPLVFLHSTHSWLHVRLNML